MVRKSLLAVCLVLGACASRERDEGTTSARLLEHEDEDMQRALGGSRLQPEDEPDEDPLVQVSRKIEEDKGASDQPKAVEQHDDHAEQANKKVGVKGIHGTLSPFDVKVTMEKQAKAFGKCHEPRARKVPALAGGVEFNIRVLASGEVADVHVRQSDLGDRVLERCMSDVIRNTRFPAPHGGEATVQYNMALAPGRKHRAPEAWDSERIEKVLKKNRGELLETCEVKRPGSITVTAYVSKRGKVLAAGVAAPDDKAADKFDCIADTLRTWSMPKPRKGIAKVSFPLKG
ncbi:MAG: AgmX/PglI C-terminal domain-containing protein [Polyangiales bacterium]